jgi:hypothetical protein
MKYQVQIKYTNPAHEHVSLRRRVDTVTRLVEASTEEEAVYRATRQQRALGFMIKEASVVKPEAIKEEVEQVDEGKGYSPGWMLKKDPKLGKKLKGKINLAKKRQASYGNPKAGISVKEEVEQVTEAEREAGYKMSPAVRKAQAESDKLSKVEKPAQAGTLAAQRAIQRAMEREMKRMGEETVNTKITKAVNRVVEAAKNARGNKQLNPNKPATKINTKPEMDANIK